MKSISIYLTIIMSVLLFACKKETTTATNQPPSTSQSKGIVQQLLLDSAFDISLGNLYGDNLSAVYASEEGLVFKPVRDIRIYSVGCKVGATGTYKIQIHKIRPFARYAELDTLLQETVTINNINDFQYKDLSKELLLAKDQEYVIHYYSTSGSSIYNAIYKNWDRTGATTLLPLTRDGVTIEGHFYNYYDKTGFLFRYSAQDAGNAFRGLVDFKYR